MKKLFLAFIIALSLNSFQENLIVVVPDGMSFDCYSIIRKFSDNPRGKIAIDRFNNVFIYETTADKTYITDSAASATAMFCGYKTYNGAIGWRPGQKKSDKKSENIMEFCRRKGIITGLLTNMRITHATPAAAYAHSEDRDMEEDIALQLPSSGISVIIGGGMKYLLPKSLKGARKDSKNIVSMMKKKNYEIVETKEQMKNPVKPGKNVLAIFSLSNLPYELYKDRTKLPTLTEMSMYGLRILNEKSKSEGKDFLYIIESGLIDYAAHDMSREALIFELFETDMLLDSLADFADSTNTSVLVITDHATANPVITGIKDGDSIIVYDSYFSKKGFSYPYKESLDSSLSYINIDWISEVHSSKEGQMYSGGGEHTASDLAGYLLSKHEHGFRGFMKNSDIFAKMKEILTDEKNIE